ncbi:hypothetical protein CEXT_527771 [Caerostris extrusa]|uniref:Uncharacterized protein n=1 Tax=Caerostris extrusa TaxID=172846 RepID=A0AAV4XRH5_CAEEX|nr:hypothetical protein CEXT_527771 [Caerostris extrusa]
MTADENGFHFAVSSMNGIWGKNSVACVSMTTIIYRSQQNIEAQIVNHITQFTLSKMSTFKEKTLVQLDTIPVRFLR